MFLRCSTRNKDGKTHWSLVENRRLAGDRIVQRHVLYLGEINDEQQLAWRRGVEIFDEGDNVARTLSLVAARAVMALNHAAMVRIHERRPVDAVSRRHSAFGRFRRLT